MTEIAVRVLNARQNNLKGFSVEILFGDLVCITGVSGSGKSTFIEYCIAELAQRRHLALSGKKLSNFYDEDFDTNVVPFVSYIQQGVLSVSNRSVVGTALGLVQKLRQLIVPYAEVHDSQGNVLEPLNAHKLVQWCQRHYPTAHLSLAVCLEHMVLGPAARYIRPAMQQFPDASFKVVDALTPYEHTDTQPAEKYVRSVFRSHKDIYAVVPNLKVSDSGTLMTTFDQAMSSYPDHDLILVVQNQDQIKLIHLSDALLSLVEAQVYYKPSETLLSFNSNAPISGRCPVCNGTGRQKYISPSEIFGKNDIPVAVGGLTLKFNTKTGQYLYFSALCDEIRGVLKAHGESLTATWVDLKDDIQKILAFGSTEPYQPLAVTGKPTGKKKPFVGIIERITHKLDSNSSASQGLKHLRSDQDCHACSGTRFNYSARAVYFMGKSYTELLEFTLSDAQTWFHDLLSYKDFEADKPVISTLESICQSCTDVGIGHLQLNRATNTLSGGEAQRLRISRDLWGRLDNACYILDEPTRGLHAVDILRVIHVLNRLRSPQNCILLVEHNPVMVSQADRVIELGPQGGSGGGEVVYDGAAKDCPMLNMAAAFPAVTTLKPPSGWIVVKNANLRTVVNQSFKLPLGRMTCFTGVSGSGKTTLLAGILVPALEQLQDGLGSVCSQTGEIECGGVESFRLIYLPQSAIGGSYRSRVLTYIGLADMFREWFCQQSGAADNGLTASHFSVNTPEGQCLTCEGLGRVTSVVGSHEKCPSCCGSGFNPESTFVRTQNMSIEQWMNCSLSDLAHYEKLPEQLRLAAKLACDLELGHLSLGRSIPTLSGGECQRLRIIKALLDVETRKNGLYQQHLIVVMDEPAAGLHPKDVQKLTTTLKNNITDKGHTLLLVEHNLNLIGCADWIVDVGPGSAAKGGQVLFSGSMAEFFKATLPTSPTHSAFKGKLYSERVSRPYKQVTTSKPTNEFEKTDVLKTVSRFNHYLKGESESLDDVEPISDPIVPAYALTSDNLSCQTLAHVAGLDVPLSRLFAAASTCDQQSIIADMEKLNSQALHLLHQGWRIGWFPSPTGNELTTWSDTIKAIKSHTQLKQGEWFDGKQISTKVPAITPPSDLNKVRLLLTQPLEPNEAVRRAFSLGKGWVSLVCPDNGEVRDLSMRAIDSKHLRLGSRWQVPQIFDSGFAQNACPLCGGKGHIESVDHRLIFRDVNNPLDNDQLFQPYALEVLKLARRQDMLPAAKRLKESGLIDLTVPQQDMSPAVAAAFWFGYPYKAFLKIGGDKNILGDWHRWLGINKTVLLGMWKCSSREWAEKVNASRFEMKCPECNGSGFGWEAQQRVLADVSIQDIYLTYSGLQLRSWLGKLHLKSDAATKAQHDIICRIDSITEMAGSDFKVFEKLKHLPDKTREAALSMYISNHTLNRAIIYREHLSP